MHPDFDRFLQKKLQSASAENWLGVIVLGGLSAILMFMSLQSEFLIIFFLSLGVFFLTLYLMSTHKGALKGPQYWINLFNEEPEKIVWVKPIVVKHKLAIVINLYQEQKFQVCTSNGETILLNCNDKNEQTIFFAGIKQHIPNAHIGYSTEIGLLYNSDKKAFLSEMKKRGDYLAVQHLKSY